MSILLILSKCYKIQKIIPWYGLGGRSNLYFDKKNTIKITTNSLLKHIKYLYLDRSLTNIVCVNDQIIKYW